MARPRSRTIRDVTEQTAMMADVVAVIERTLDNLANAEGGYPSSVVGASPPTGTQAVDTAMTATERAALNPDLARLARERLDHLVDELSNPLRDLHALVTRWSYATHTPPLDLKTNVEWCDSCLRGQWCEPRYKSRWCWFCADFRSRYGRLPSLALLERHHRGARITETDRARDRNGARRITKRGR